MTVDVKTWTDDEPAPRLRGIPIRITRPDRFLEALEAMQAAWFEGASVFVPAARNVLKARETPRPWLIRARLANVYVEVECASLPTAVLVAVLGLKHAWKGRND